MAYAPAAPRRHLTQPVKEIVRRVAARVLVVDEHDRVLLFRGSDPTVPDSPHWWFTAGGGVDPGEDPATAARREVLEETGIVVDELVGPLWTRHEEFDFLGKRYIQDEEYFVARVSGATVDETGLHSYELEFMHGHHWWSVADLAATSDTVYPASLAEILDSLLREGPPTVVRQIH